MAEFIEYPKMLYKGVFNPEAGLGPLQKTTVNNAAEERAKLKDGFVTADDIETLIPAPAEESAPARRGAKKNGDDSEE